MSYTQSVVRRHQRKKISSFHENVFIVYSFLVFSMLLPSCHGFICGSAILFIFLFFILFLFYFEVISSYIPLSVFPPFLHLTFVLSVNEPLFS